MCSNLKRGRELGARPLPDKVDSKAPQMFYAVNVVQMLIAISMYIQREVFSTSLFSRCYSLVVFKSCADKCNWIVYIHYLKLLVLYIVPGLVRRTVHTYRDPLADHTYCVLPIEGLSRTVSYANAQTHNAHCANFLAFQTLLNTATKVRSSYGFLFNHHPTDQTLRCSATEAPGHQENVF